MLNANRHQNDNRHAGTSLGADIRGLRKSRGMTLSEMADEINRSVGFISQVERGISTPSIEDLKTIAAAFDVPVSWFFANENLDDREQGLVVRKKHRRALGTKEDGIVEELLSPDLGGAFEMFRTKIEPGASLERDIYRDTEEAGFIVSGRLHIWIDGELFKLKTGDSFRFDHKPYRWRNPGKKQAVVVWVVSPPVY